MTSQRRCRRRWGASVVLLFLGALVVCGTGLSCDSDAAATFRQEATEPIGEGVKTIVDGVLDGLIAAIKEAGSSSSSSSSSSRSQ